MSHHPIFSSFPTSVDREMAAMRTSRRHLLCLVKSRALWGARSLCALPQGSVTSSSCSSSPSQHLINLEYEYSAHKSVFVSPLCFFPFRTDEIFFFLLSGVYKNVRHVRSLTNLALEFQSSRCILASSVGMGF